MNSLLFYQIVRNNIIYLIKILIKFYLDEGNAISLPKVKFIEETP